MSELETPPARILSAGIMCMCVLCNRVSDELKSLWNVLQLMYIHIGTCALNVAE